MKRKMFFECVFVLIFVFLIVSIGAVTVVKEKDTFSDYENRTLAVPPVASFASVSEGTYFSLWESYFSDHALGRKTLLKTSVLLDHDVFHRPVINDVIVLEDQLL
ncbi:MAG: hypothetical protein IJO94_07260, partial [Firmicutes bacterium]|nr:hypothetical protein [Bacillota bacterium]